MKVLDAGHLAFADWPGNNRIATLRNLAEDDRVAMLFLFPGLEVFLRVNGRGRATIERGILDLLQEGAKTPKAAVVVAVEQVLFHCGKAINRAGLWRPEGRVERASLPSVGQVKAALTGGSAAETTAADAHYARSVRDDLY